jgi:iron(III) transport system substrate-binding protein
MRRLICFVVAGLLSLSANRSEADDHAFPATAANPRKLVIASTTDLGIIRPVIEAYQLEHPDVEILYREMTTIALYARSGTACGNGDFYGDLVISSAMDLQVKLVNDGCAAPVESTILDGLPDYARWRNELFGLTFEPAVIVYNRRLIALSEAPRDHFDLLDLLRQPERFTGRIGTYDIEQSGLGYLYATLDARQSSTWGRLIEAMGRNRVQLFCCTSEILDRVADGRLTFGYNVLGSYALAEAADKPDLAIVLPSDYTLVLTRAAFTPKTARNHADAVAFLDFTQVEKGRRILSDKARLFSPIDGMDELFKQPGVPADARQSLRPVALSPALMTGLDTMKRRLFLKQWQESLTLKDN